MRNYRRIGGAARVVWAVIGAAALVGGCDKDDGRGPKAGTAPQRGATTGGAVAATGTGVIRGRVKFDGPKPELKNAEKPCHAGVMMMIPDESVLVGADGGLKNAIVFLKNPPAGAGGPAHAAAVVDQKGCVYVPHAIAVQAGESIKFLNSDPVLHNVHVFSKESGESNVGVNPGASTDVRVTGAEFFPVKCDVHPWMLCRVGAFDHPWFAVTGEDGSFEFAGLPAGTYTVGVVLEKLGRREQDVTVANDKPSEMTITVAKKQPQ